jgi:hypothetical protein
MGNVSVFHIIRRIGPEGPVERMSKGLWKCRQPYPVELPERAMIPVARSLNYIPGLKKYRPIHARMVAQRMISSTLDETPGIRVYTLEEVFSE